MRNLAIASVWLTSAVLGGSALAQNPQPFEDHLLSEEEYLNTPAPYPPPQYGQPQYGQPPYGQPPYEPPADPNAPYGAGQPYDGQPSYAYDQAAGQPDDPSYEIDDGYDAEAYQDFQSDLSPYGSWVDVAGYGEVWTPSVGIVGADFTPYATGGHWVLTEYGWTWVSDWDWGWAPFHYGRWMSLVGYGWCWRPGRVWGPGWVSWRAGGGYVGWAPLPPRGVRIAPPAAVHGPWRFTTASEFGSQHPNYVAPRVAAAVYNHTATVANFQSAAHTARFNGGPTAALLGHSATQVGLSGLRNAAPHSAIVPRPTSPSLNRVGAPLHTPTTLATPRAPYAAPVRPQQPAYRSDLVGPVPPGYRAPSVVTRPSYAPGYGQRYGAPGYGAPSYAAPHYATQPSYAAPRYAPNYAPGYASPHYGAPSYHTAPSYNYGAPHYSAPSYSAPHYSAPSYSAPHYSAPSYSAPHYSAPSRPSYSAPAFHGGGGGGMHFGGGGGGHFGGGHR